MSESIVLFLEREALKPEVSDVSLLRTEGHCDQTKSHRSVVWIDHELNGYQNILADDLPSYRRLLGTPKAWNPYHG